MAARIAKDIGPFLPVTSEDTLTLVLETLAVVVQIDDGKWITEELARALVVAVLEVWIWGSRKVGVVSDKETERFRLVANARLNLPDEYLGTARQQQQ